MSDVLDRLKAALAARYKIERELGADAGRTLDQFAALWLPARSSLSQSPMTEITTRL